MSEVLVIGPRLRELEKVIEKGMQSFVEVGNALLAIKQEKRYKERGFKSFDDYVREHWNMGRAAAYRMIEAAQVVEEVSSMDDTSVPSNVRQTRELARADDPAEVWAEVVEQHEPAEITAAVIREHVEARKPNGTPTPPAPDAVDFAAYLSAVTSAVRAAVRAGATTQELYNAYQAGFH